MSLEQLLHHPLIAQVAPDLTFFICRTDLENSGPYAIVPKPTTEAVGVEPQQYTSLCLDWIRRKGIVMHRLMVALVHPNEHHVFVADYVGEKNGEPVLVFAYYSEKMRGPAGVAMRRYAMKVGEVCREFYGVCPLVAVVNVYGEGRSEGCIMDTRCVE